MTTNDTTDDETHGQRSRRRRLLKWLAGIGIGSFIIGILTPVKDLALAVETETEEEGKGPIGQKLVFAHSHETDDGHTHDEGTIITTDKLQAPEAALAAPEQLASDNDYLLLLHKLDPDELEEPTNMEMTDEGFLAYSAICTHLGCTVSWSDEDHEVGKPHDHCPCHTGEFDPYRGAEPAGGPVTVPLPQIGIQINDDNELEIASDFEEEGGD